MTSESARKWGVAALAATLLIGSNLLMYAWGEAKVDKQHKQDVSIGKDIQRAAFIDGVELCEEQDVAIMRYMAENLQGADKAFAPLLLYMADNWEYTDEEIEAMVNSYMEEQWGSTTTPVSL